MKQMLLRNMLRSIPLFLFLVFQSGIGSAQTNTWLGLVNNNWNTAGNWSLGLVPTAAHDIVFNTNAGVVLSGNVVGGSLSVINNSTVQIISNAAANRTITLNSSTGTTFLIQSGSSLSLNNISGGGSNTTGVLFAAGSVKTATIAGTLLLDAASTNDNGLYNASNTLTTVSGTLTNRGIVISNPTNLIFSSTGIYDHNRNTGIVASATWNTGSLCRLSGVTNNMPTGLNQTFSNLTFNSALTSNVVLTSSLTVNGNLVLANTGSIMSISTNATGRNITVGGDMTMSAGQFRGANGTGACNINVAGNFVQSAGNFVVKNANGNATMNVGGNFSMTGGNFILRANSVGTGSLDVNGNLNLSGNGILSLTNSGGVGTMNLAGNLTISGIALLTEIGGGAADQGSLIFDGTSPQLFNSNSGITNSVNVTVNSGSTLQMAAPGSAVTGGGSFTLSPNATLGITSIDGITATGGGAVGNVQVSGTRNFNQAANYLYNGPGAQLTGTGYPTDLTGDLIINNPGNPVTLNNLRAISNGGTINLVAGTFAAGSNLVLNSVAEILRSGGSMTATTLLGAGLYNITFTGASKTTGGEFLGGQAIPIRVNNVTVNLDAGQSLTMGAGAPVLGFSGSAMAGVLTLSNGLVNTGLTNGLLLSDLATCPAGGSVAAHVNGPMVKFGAAAFVYPVGNGGFYLPVGISGANNNIAAALPGGSSGLLVQPFKANPNTAVGAALNPGPPPLGSITQCYYWDISRVFGVGNIFVWPSIDNIGACDALPNLDLNSLVVAHFEGGAWRSYDRNSTATVNGSNFFSQGNGISVFSPFTIGSTTLALPVELLGFTASLSGSSVQLSWQTASEQNNAFFEVERSSNGTDFRAIGKVNGAGNSTTLKNYGFVDRDPATGVNYYRLRQVDLDGKFAYSKVVTVNLAPASAVLKVYPNPASSYLVAEDVSFANKKVTVQMFDNQGRQLINQVMTAPSNGRLQIDFGAKPMANGQYILRLSADNRSQQSQVIIRN